MMGALARITAATAEIWMAAWVSTSLQIGLEEAGEPCAGQRDPLLSYSFGLVLVVTCKRKRSIASVIPDAVIFAHSGSAVQRLFGLTRNNSPGSARSAKF